MKTDKKFQVEAIFPYVARRADELSFNAGDLINVSQMQPDGEWLTFTTVTWERLIEIKAKTNVK